MPGNIKSQAQARLFGMVAAGDHPNKDVHGLTPEIAKESLRGVKVKKLAQKIHKKKGE